MAEPNKPGAPDRNGIVRAAVVLLTGANDPSVRGDASDVPGPLSFIRANWKDGAQDEGFFRRYRRLSKEYRKARERAAGNLRTYETIAQAAAFTPEFAALLFASCIIATFGLFQGSTGVIIGAMLIAPLMMPILGFSMAVVWGDQRLLWRSVGTLLVGIAIVLALSATLASITPGIELNGEIRGRINPNLFDILVAVASGLIGAYAYANPRISPSIAGVAIAVALMPPMCTVGIGLGLADSRIASGAMLLFLSNLLGIALAASFVFWRLRIHPLDASSSEVGTRVRRNVALTAVLLILVALPLGYFMKQGYELRELDGRVRNALRAIPDGEIVSFSVQRFGDGYEVRSVMIVPPGTDQTDIDALRTEIERMVPSDTSLRLYFVRTDAAAVVAATVAPEASPASAAAATEPPAPAKPSAKQKSPKKRRQR